MTDRTDEEIIEQIKHLIETNVKPAVAKDVFEYEIMYIIWTLIFCDNLQICVCSKI